MGSSPILLDGKLFIVCMQDKGNSYLLALDAGTGKKIWKKSRDFPAVGEARDSYTSPIVYRSNGSSQIVVCGAEHINAYDPKDGKQLWVSGGLEVSHPYGRSVSSPTAGEGLIIAVSSGYQLNLRCRGSCCHQFMAGGDHHSTKAARMLSIWPVFLISRAERSSKVSRALRSWALFPRRSNPTLAR